MRNAPEPSANISLRPAPVRTITGPERVGAMVEDTGAMRQACGDLLLPPLDQQRQQARHQMLVLHDHGEFVAVVLAVQCQHLVDHARLGGRHSRSMWIVVRGLRR